VRVLIVIPAYNEEAALAGLLAEIRELVIDGVTTDVVVIDDGSTDRTAQVARAAGARVLRLSRNLGIGGAVQSGIRVARREGFDYAVQIDGDGQHPPSELTKLLAATRTEPAPDLIVGTRYTDAANFRSTFLRRLGTWWLRVVLRVVTRTRYTDPTSGFRLYGPRALRRFDETYPYDFPEPESLAIARASRLVVAEQPVAMRPRQGGTSSIFGFSTVYYMMKVTVAVLLTYVRTAGRKEGTDDAIE